MERCHTNIRKPMQTRMVFEEGERSRSESIRYGVGVSKEECSEVQLHVGIHIGNGDPDGRPGGRTGARADGRSVGRGKNLNNSLFLAWTSS